MTHQGFCICIGKAQEGSLTLTSMVAVTPSLLLFVFKNNKKDAWGLASAVCKSAFLMQNK